MLHTWFNCPKRVLIWCHCCSLIANFWPWNIMSSWKTLAVICSIRRSFNDELLSANNWMMQYHRLYQLLTVMSIICLANGSRFCTSSLISAQYPKTMFKNAVSLVPPYRIQFETYLFTLKCENHLARAAFLQLLVGEDMVDYYQFYRWRTLLWVSYRLLGNSWFLISSALLSHNSLLRDVFLILSRFKIERLT